MSTLAPFRNIPDKSVFLTSLREVVLSIIQEKVPTPRKAPSMGPKKHSSLTSQNKRHFSSPPLPKEKLMPIDNLLKLPIRKRPRLSKM